MIKYNSPPPPSPIYTKPNNEIACLILECEQLCIFKDGAPECRCCGGYKLNPDNRTCRGKCKSILKKFIRNFNPIEKHIGLAIECRIFSQIVFGGMVAFGCDVIDDVLPRLITNKRLLFFISLLKL